MRTLTNAALLVGLLLTPAAAFSGPDHPNAPQDPHTPSLEVLAQRLFPQSRVDAVEPTPIPGLYELRSGQSILYMDKTGRYVIIGELYDFTAKQNLTAQRILNAGVLRFSDLPLDLAIRLGPKDATRHLAVFDDVDCPFCRKFHREVVPALLKDGVAVHVFLYPLTSLHPQADAKSKAVWCSADPVNALDAALHDKPLDDAFPTCKTPIRQINELASRLGIAGTPALLLDNNQRIDGFIDYQALMARWKVSERR